MKIRYNSVMAVVLLVLGVLCLFLNLWMVALGEDLYMGAIAGGLVTVIGILHLSRPMCTVHPDRVQLHPLIGPSRRPIPFQTLALDQGKLFAVGADGSRKRLPYSRWASNSRDWDAVFGRLGVAAQHGGR